MADVERMVYTVPEVAQALGISERTVYALCRNGTLPAKKVGKHWMVLKEALKRYLEETQQP